MFRLVALFPTTQIDVLDTNSRQSTIQRLHTYYYGHKPTEGIRSSSIKKSLKISETSPFFFFFFLIITNRFSVREQHRYVVSKSHPVFVYTRAREGACSRDLHARDKKQERGVESSLNGLNGVNTWYVLDRMHLRLKGNDSPSTGCSRQILVAVYRGIYRRLPSYQSEPSGNVCCTRWPSMGTNELHSRLGNAKKKTERGG